MKIKIFISALLLFALATKVFSQNEEWKKFYVYKTMDDLLKGNKLFYGYEINGNGGKFKLDSAGKKIKINVNKMGIFAYEHKMSASDQGTKYVVTYQAGDPYVGGNNYTYAISSSVHDEVKEYDENGFVKSLYLVNLQWPIRFEYYKTDAKTGKTVKIVAPERKRTLGSMEEISDIEGLLTEYPDMLNQYFKEKKEAVHYKKPSLFFFWELGWFKKYADRLAADMEAKEKK